MSEIDPLEMVAQEMRDAYNKTVAAGEDIMVANGLNQATANQLATAFANYLMNEMAYKNWLGPASIRKVR